MVQTTCLEQNFACEITCAVCCTAVFKRKIQQMSVLTVQIGQCGNQLGQAMFESLASEKASAGAYFRHGAKETQPTARAVLIDMESKVVTSALRRRKHWLYDTRSVVTQQGGAGNNWALGYNTLGPSNRDAGMLTLYT